MSGERVERRLAAILAADVAGYSRLMGEDEAGTLARLRTHRCELIDPQVAEHKGRIVKTTGDGILIEFPSVVEAVACAVAVQQGMAERNAGTPEHKRIVFRVGINLGDVIVQDGDIHGDGVNVAARLEGIAEPGEICISGIVHEQVEGRLDCVFEDIGEQTLKNIARPVRVYRVRPAVAQDAPVSVLQGSSELALPDKPSVAVLPFQNMSGDPEQEYFADGMVEEIITALSRIRWLFVIARNSSFTYKGKAIDVKRVARELGVRYVLEGSVRKASNRVRVSGQLIDTATGAHIWAERFDGALDNVFELQDQVASSVAGAIEPHLRQMEINRALSKPTRSLTAYDYFLRGLALVHRYGGRQQTNEALRLLYSASEADPHFAAPYAVATWCFLWRKLNLWTEPDDLAETVRLARHAVRLGGDDASVLCWSGLSLAMVAKNIAEAGALADRAIALNINLAQAWNLSGWVGIWRGQHDSAIECFNRAMRLSPLDPGFHWMLDGMAEAHFYAGRYDEAVSWAEKALGQHHFASALNTLAASHALAGRLDDAHEALKRVLLAAPARRLSNLREREGPLRPADLAMLEAGLRRAGLPED